MADLLSSYSLQYWLESSAQGYLMGTEFGHAPGAREPASVLADEALRSAAIRSTVQLVAAERSSVSASAELLLAAPDEPSRRFLASQVFDEARHAEVFAQRLLDLGVHRLELEDLVRREVDPRVAAIDAALREPLRRRDFTAILVAHNLVLDGIACGVFEALHARSRDADPKLAATLAGAIADEQRHTRFGETRLLALLRGHPGERAAVTRARDAVWSAALDAIAALCTDPQGAPDAAMAASVRAGVEQRFARLGLDEPRALRP